MTNHICKTCGGSLLLENGVWVCKYCGNTYEDDSVKKEEEMLRSLLDEYKTEQVANLRRNLYDALNAKYIDSESIVGICRRIKEYLPDDFMANFYEIANANDNKRTAEAINAIDVSVNSEYVSGDIDFILRSFTSEFHLPLVNLVERAFAKKNKQKFEEYHTKISEEA